MRYGCFPPARGVLRLNRRALGVSLWIVLVASAVHPAAPPKPDDAAEHRPVGYLFAHTTRDDYHRLYYAVSRDGLRWQPLNDHKRIFDEYRGLPEVCRGSDGRYYLLSRQGYQGLPAAVADRDSAKLDLPRPYIGIWVSDDLVSWQKMNRIAPQVPERYGFQPGQIHYHGAPKMFFGEATGRHVITFHTTPVPPVPSDPWRAEFWQGQRTYYVWTRDFREFSQPHRLMPGYDFPTIDVIMQRDGDRYFIIMKDEREPSAEAPTGKSLRVASGPSATGPWSAPSGKISPNWREAPTVVRRLDGEGWYLYFEHYPCRAYETLAAPGLGGPWVEVPAEKQQWPPGARHGRVITVNRREWEALHKAFGE